MIADIEKPARDALYQIMRSVSPPMTQKDAVSDALISYATQKPKRAKAASDTMDSRGEQAGADLIGDNLKTARRHYLRRGMIVPPSG